MIIIVYLCPSGTGGRLMWDGMWRSLITGYAWTGTSKFSSPWHKHKTQTHDSCSYRICMAKY